jgi:hypothetical protein
MRSPPHNDRADNAVVVDSTACVDLPTDTAESVDTDVDGHDARWLFV